MSCSVVTCPSSIIHRYLLYWNFSFHNIYNLQDIPSGDNLFTTHPLPTTHHFGAFTVMANVIPLGTLMKSFLFLTRNHWHSLFTYYLCCFLSHSDLALVMALVLDYLVI